MDHSSIRVRIEDLLEHEAFVRRLGRILVGSGSDPDDVAQDAWLAAIESPGEERGRTRGWLATIVRNLARDRKRSVARARRRESSAARPEATPPVSWFVERQDSARRVAAAVVALGEPYSSVVVLRFYEDKSPRVIAAELGVPVATVKSQLQRAIARLRVRLDGAFDGGRAAWMSALLPLAKGGVAMTLNAKVALGGAALVIGIVSWFVVAAAWSDPRPRPSSDSVAPGPLASGAREGGGTLTQPRDAETRASDSRAVIVSRFQDPPATPRDGALVLSVAWSDGTPASGVPVWLDPGQEPVRRVRRATGKDGTIRFVGVWRGRHFVNSDRGGSLDVECAEGRETHATLTIPRGIDVEGTLVDARGVPVEGASVYVLLSFDDVVEPESTRTGPNGTFRLRDVAPRRMVCAREPRHAPSSAVGVVGAPGMSDAIRLVLPGDGGSVRGRLVGDDHRPVAGAAVWIGSAVRGFARDSEHRESRPPLAIHVRSDRDGLFAASGVAVGDVPVSIDSPDYAPCVISATLGSSPLDLGEIHLTHGSKLCGVLRDGRGAVLTSGVVSVKIGERSSRSANVDASGSFGVKGIPAGAHQATVGLGIGASTLLTFDGSNTVTWNPVIALGVTLRGELVDEEGSPGMGWRILVEAAPDAGLERGDPRFHGEGFCDSRPTDSRRSASRPGGRGGSFEIRNLAEVPYVVAVQAPRALAQFTTVVARGVVPGRDPVRIVVPRTAEPSCRIRGVIEDEDGRPMGGVNVDVAAGGLDFRSGGSQDVLSSAGTGEFLVESAPAGASLVSFAAPRHGRWTSGVHDLKRGETWDLGTIRLSPAGRALLTLLDTDGVRRDGPGPLAFIFDARSHRMQDVCRLADGTGSVWLPPGESIASVVDVTAAGAFAASTPFSIRRDVDAPVELRFHRGRSVSVSIPDRADLGLGLSLSAVARNEKGEVVDTGVVRLDQRGVLRCGFVLVPGNWTIEILGESGLLGSARVTVGEEPTPIPEVRIDLR